MGAKRPPTAPHLAEELLLDELQRVKLLLYARSRFGLLFEDAEDLLQDALLELLERRPQVRDPEAYLFAVFRRRCCRFASSVRAAREVLEPEAALGSAADPVGPDQIYGRVALRQAFEGISSTCRQILCAFYVEGRSLRETAETLALAHSGVSKTISRCLRRLRAHLC